MDENLSKQLAYIIDKGTRTNPLPMRKGNSIRIVHHHTFRLTIDS